MTIKAGVLGVGGAGRFNHCQPITQTPGFELVAIGDTDQANLELALKSYPVRAYPTPEELFNDREVELVAIATPSSLHGPQVIQALEAGKHVVTEKPMCMNLAEADRMVETAKRTGKQLSVFHNRRWDQDYLWVKEVIASGSLGEVLRVESRISGWTGVGWRAEARWGGGVRYDWVSHMTDQLLRLIASPVVSVAGEMESVLSADVDDYTFATYRFANGVSAYVECNGASGVQPPRWHIVGTRATLQAPGDAWTRYTIGTVIGGRPGVFTPRLPAAGDFVSTVNAYYRSTYDSLASGKPLPVTAAEAREVVRVLDAIAESARTGRTVYFD